MKIRAISIHQPYASAIATGGKTIETRTWPTRYRGPLLICSTKQPRVDDLPVGQALAICRVADCRPMTPNDVAAAQCPYTPDLYAWMLENIEEITPFPVTGRQGFYTVDVDPELAPEDGE